MRRPQAERTVASPGAATPNVAMIMSETQTEALEVVRNGGNVFVTGQSIEAL